METQDADKPEKLPPLQDIILSTSLYYPMPFDIGDKDKLVSLRNGNIKIDAYCVNCERDSIFKTMQSFGGGAGMPAPAPDWMFKDGQFSWRLYCQRCSIAYSYIFRVECGAVKKIGQYPSIEDIASADTIRYKGILGKDDYSDLRRAGGLFSHGIGIGSFVYLRRIFERLILKHRENFEKLNGEIAGFDSMRMNEKISALSSTLPAALVKNRAAYGILSKGIHELSEDDCRAFFPVVKAAIVQILEQELRAKEEAKAEAQLQREVEAIATRLKS